MFKKYDGLTYHISKYEFLKFNNVYRNKKHKEKLRIVSRTTSTSSCLVLIKEFGPIKKIVELYACGVLFEIFPT